MKLVRSGVDGLVLAAEKRDAAQRYAALVLEMLAKPEMFADDHEKGLRDIASAMSQRFRVGSPLRFERPEDVPADVVPALGLYLHDQLYLDDARRTGCS